MYVKYDNAKSLFPQNESSGVKSQYLPLFLKIVLMCNTWENVIGCIKHYVYQNVPFIEMCPSFTKIYPDSPGNITGSTTV